MIIVTNKMTPTKKMATKRLDFADLYGFKVRKIIIISMMISISIVKVALS